MQERNICKKNFVLIIDNNSKLFIEFSNYYLLSKKENIETNEIKLFK